MIAISDVATEVQRVGVQRVATAPSNRMPAAGAGTTAGAIVTV